MRIYRKRGEQPWGEIKPDEMPSVAELFRSIRAEEISIKINDDDVTRYRLDDPDADQRLFDALIDLENMALRLKAYLSPAADDAKPGGLSEDEISDILRASQLLTAICDESGI